MRLLNDEKSIKKSATLVMLSTIPMEDLLRLVKWVKAPNSALLIMGLDHLLLIFFLLNCVEIRLSGDEIHLI